MTTFTPTGAFGLFSGEYSDVNFSDDSLNVGNQNSGTGHTANTPLPVPHYLHDLRIYPAYGPGHVLIANTYIVAVDPEPGAGVQEQRLPGCRAAAQQRDARQRSEPDPQRLQ